jgi:uncharacterized membrane protein YgcG
MRRLLLPALLALTALASPSLGQTERILRFDSDITVHEDGSMAVRETVKVQAQGIEIKRGIYRDFPTLYRTSWFTRRTVPFEVTEVLRDGRPEPHHTAPLTNGVRVYAGSADVFLEPGVYTYTFAYETDRQIGYFEDHDELYWNVTGNGWAFPIDVAAATVALPSSVPSSAIRTEGYTGPQGAKGKDFTASVIPNERAAFQTAHALPPKHGLTIQQGAKGKDFPSSILPNGRATFQTTHALSPKHGLTIVVMWPKGYVRPVVSGRRLADFANDNPDLLAGAFGLLALLFYYLVAWDRVGRDPRRGVIMPLFEPPPGLSPAAVRYLVRMGYDNRCLTAAVLNMAVKGYLTIEENAGGYALRKAERSASALSAEERKAATAFFLGGSPIELTQSNHSFVGGAVHALKRALAMGMEKRYFLTNRPYLVPGIVISVATLLLTGVLGARGPEPAFMPLFLYLWLSIWTVGVAALVVSAGALWRAALAGGHPRLPSIGGAVGMTLFCLPFLGGEALGIYFLGKTSSVWVVAIVSAAAVINLAFYHLLKAPTSGGRTLMDQVEGFRMYLDATEEDELKFLYQPRRTPEVFERYLPYAVALGVETRWTERFSDVLAAAGRAGEAYSPAWYSGLAWTNLGASGFVSSMGSSLSTAIASSSTAPGSSSGGGGGGSSGGGGGGGGGGGW